MAGISFAQNADDFLLGQAIHFANEVIATLGRYVQGVYSIDIADDQVAGGTGSAHGNSQHWVHGSPLRLNAVSEVKFLLVFYSFCA